MVHSIKKMISVMDAGRNRRRLVASEGRDIRGTEEGADIRGWRQADVMETGKRDGDRQM
ncbi:MAG: hypothetical protein KIG45_00630 [Bacteroidales bacterium]|nr:hypothetical protein [Bacteroidales bacterium]